ncbi:MAG: GTP 3',8-cyclase MoaA [Spirochaetaceae bacterium]
MYDRYNREITYLRVSVTDRCNLRCSYCTPPGGFEAMPRRDILSFERITEIVRVAAGMGIRKVRLTGGEPLVRRGIVELVGMLAAVPGLETLAMTTNGILLPRYARQLRAAGLQAVNISLDTIDPAGYREITGGGRLADAVAGVDAAVAAGFEPIKVNAVVPDAARDLTALGVFCAERGVILQRIGLYHLAHKNPDSTAVDRPPKCEICNRLRLTADGKLKPCLHSNHEFPVHSGNVEEAVRAAVAAKPPRAQACTNRAMVSIGG